MKCFKAAQALVSRNIDAVYIPGDNIVYQSFPAVAKVVNDAKIPLINGDPNVKGPLLSVGPGYYYSGKAAAELVARVLLGENPSKIPMRNVSINNSILHEDVAKKLNLTVSPATKAAIKAAAVPPKENKLPTLVPYQNPNPSGKLWNIAVYSYLESPPFEDALAGIKKVLSESKLVEGKDYKLRYRSAQGDIAALNGIIDTALTERADLFLPLSTPGLQATIRKVSKQPIVFGIVSDPVIAGAGTSYTDHFPNVTGVSVSLAADEMLDVLQKHFPEYKRIGTLFCPNEANSENSRKLFISACNKRGITLECVAVNSSTELADAAIALMSRPIDAVVQIPDNLSSAGFSAIANAARKTQTPLLSLNSSTVQRGAAFAIGRDYYEAGEETAITLLQVIGGADPANIPFRVSPQILSSASLENAKKVGMTIPEALLK